MNFFLSMYISFCSPSDVSIYLLIMVISTGLDPKSRQDLWKVINEAKQTSAVILTTHSMEEADAICDRLMIMSEGEIKCIGVSADLKNRYVLLLHSVYNNKNKSILISFRLLTLLPSSF